MNTFKDKIIKLLKDGVSNKDICLELGCVNGTVSYYRKAFNIHKVKKEKPLGKLHTRLLSTGLDRDTLSEAIAKFIRKKQNAKQKGVEFTIKFEDITWNTKCPILGIDLDYFAIGLQSNSVSFDRVDNSKGYIPGNVMVVSMRANMLKADGTIEEFNKIIDFLSKI